MKARSAVITHDFTSILAGAQNEVTARKMSAYMRNKFAYLGIQTSQRRLLTKPIIKALANLSKDQLFEYVNELWQLNEREYQYIGIDILLCYQKSLNLNDLKRIYQLVQTKSWWDSVDSLASVVRVIIKNELKLNPLAQDTMDSSLKHKNMWIRRIAMIHQLGFKSQTDTNRLFEYAIALACEDEFFIQKAIGWALRDYAHYNPKLVIKFLKQNHSILPTLSYREASKHLNI